MAIINLKSIENVRDLGGIPVAGGRRVKPGLFFRGTALAHICERDQELLFRRNGIHRVIDVRCSYERDAKPDPQLESVENIWIPYLGEEMGYPYFKPLAGTRPQGDYFIYDPEDVYRSLSNPHTVRQYRKALALIFEEASAGRGVYYHCSGGKDRAGVTSMLILKLLGADFNEIAKDYELTNLARDKRLDKIFERMLPLCDDADLAWKCANDHRAKREYVAVFFDQIGKNYGSFDSFASEELDLDAGRREELRSLCTEPV